MADKTLQDLIASGAIKRNDAYFNDPNYSGSARTHELTNNDARDWYLQQLAQGNDPLGMYSSQRPGAISTEGYAGGGAASMLAAAGYDWKDPAQFAQGVKALGLDQTQTQQLMGEFLGTMEANRQHEAATKWYQDLGKVGPLIGLTIAGIGAYGALTGAGAGAGAGAGGGAAGSGLGLGTGGGTGLGIGGGTAGGTGLTLGGGGTTAATLGGGTTLSSAITGGGAAAGTIGGTGLGTAATVAGGAGGAASLLKSASNVAGILGGAATVIGAAKSIGEGKGGGSATTTTTTNVATMSDEERRLLQLQIDALQKNKDLYDQLTPVLKDQITALQKQIAQSSAQTPEEINKFVTDTLGSTTIPQDQKGKAIADEMRRRGVTATQLSQASGYDMQTVLNVTGMALTPAEKQAQAQQDILDIQLKQLKQGTNATPEQIAQIDAATKAAQTAGETDIERFRTDTIKKINEEVAAASGLMPTDTPIQTLNDRAAAEVARQQGILTSNLQGANANARLNYPIAAQQVQNATASSAGQLNIAQQNLQSTLDQRAADNRYRLFSNPFQVPQVQTGAGSLALGLGNQRIGTATQTSNASRGLGLGDYTNLLGGIGGFMRGASSLF